MPTPAKDIDLGDITLARASTVRGTVHGCDGGEVRLTSLPDLTKPPQMMAALAEIRRATVDGKEHFYFEGVPAGDWLLGARCEGQLILLQPQQLSVPPSQDIFIEAHAMAEKR
jgi:hypothetical protein